VIILGDPLIFDAGNIEGNIDRYNFEGKGAFSRDPTLRSCAGLRSEAGVVRSAMGVYFVRFDGPSINRTPDASAVPAQRGIILG
jgi:hypothetical protein